MAAFNTYYNVYQFLLENVAVEGRVFSRKLMISCIFYTLKKQVSFRRLVCLVSPVVLLIRYSVKNFRSMVFWDVTLCNLVDRYWHFRKIYSLYLHRSAMKMEAAGSVGAYLPN